MSILVNTSNIARSPTANGGPVILIVDDEPMIRDVLERGLRLTGFRPLVARGGREAVDIYRQRGEEIDLVLLDVRMPELNGPATMHALRELNPDVRCCFMSGDLGEYGSEELLANGALHLFLKPFTRGEPIATLRRLTSAEN